MKSWAERRGGNPNLPKQIGLKDAREHGELKGCILFKAQNKHPQARAAGCLFLVRFSVKLKQHMKAPGIDSNVKKQTQHIRIAASCKD